MKKILVTLMMLLATTYAFSQSDEPGEENPKTENTPSIELETTSTDLDATEDWCCFRDDSEIDIPAYPLPPGRIETYHFSSEIKKW